MRIVRASVLCFILSVACGACMGPAKNSFPAEDGEARRPVYLVSHGWHTGIVLRRADIPPAVWPEAGDFPDAEYLEVGWGDRDYYQSREFNAWLGFKAIVWPTPGALQIVGFSEAVENAFPASAIVRIELAAPGFDRLSSYIHDSYARDAAGRTIPLGPSLYGQGRFYLSREKFHLFKTCNVWTARALRAAGLPITPFLTLTSEQLLSQAQKYGRRLQTGAEHGAVAGENRAPH